MAGTEVPPSGSDYRPAKAGESRDHIQSGVPGKTADFSLKDPALGEMCAQHGFDIQFAEAITDEGSSRKYFRLRDSANHTAVLCIDRPFHAEDYDFLVLSDFLKAAGCLVPGVIDFNQKGWILLEDAGTRSLDQLFASAPKAGLQGYQSSLTELARWQALEPHPPVSTRFFDFAKLWSEMEFLFARLTRLEPICQMDLLPPPELQMFLRETCEALGRGEPRVFVHRDFHARNIMIRDPGHPEAVVFIDYQDARIGLPWYDVASLLYDPYADLSPGNRMELLGYYQDLTGHKRIPGAYYLQALQRIFKALGSYLYFTFEINKPAYSASIPRALDRLDEIILVAHLPDSCFQYIRHLRENALPRFSVILQEPDSR